MKNRNRQRRRKIGDIEKEIKIDRRKQTIEMKEEEERKIIDRKKMNEESRKEKKENKR